MIGHEVTRSTPEGWLTLAELVERTGVTVRNVRFYTSRGLLPPPIRRGRVGYYSADHLARLELIRELQGHGFTLAAIEGYLQGLPEGAAPEDVALQGAMLAPWQARSERLDRAGLQQRAGRELTDAEVQALQAFGVLTADGDAYRVATSQLTAGLALLELGFPVDAARACQEIYARHGRAMTEELNEVLREKVWPAYREAGASAEEMRRVVERLKPLSIDGLVRAYEAAVDETKRERVERRTRRTH